jgi:hypothetical protein
MKDEPLDPTKMMEIINRPKAEGRVESAFRDEIRQLDWMTPAT